MTSIFLFSGNPSQYFSESHLLQGDAYSETGIGSLRKKIYYFRVHTKYSLSSSKIEVTIYCLTNIIVMKELVQNH